MRRAFQLGDWLAVCRGSETSEMEIVPFFGVGESFYSIIYRSQGAKRRRIISYVSSSAA